MSESRDYDCFAFEQLSTLNALEDAVFSNAREFFGFDEGEYQHVNRASLNSFLGAVLENFNVAKAPLYECVRNARNY